MSNNRRFSLTSFLGLATIICLVFGLLFWFFSNRKWEELSIPYRKCQKIILDTELLLNELELFKHNTGNYPSSLAQLDLEASDNFNETINYRKINNEYQIQIVTVVGLIGSFDAIFYRPSAVYPDSWRKTNKVVEIDDWLYVIGAQNLEDIQEP